MRRRQEVLDTLDEMFDRVWYERSTRQGKDALNLEDLDPEIREAVLKARRRVESRYPDVADDLDDPFVVGFINGKLASLRWMLGCDWDEDWILDT